MKILIIEDEIMAAERMEELIIEVCPEARILARLDSIKNSVAWFNSNEMPDLAFFDIQLADGLSFEIFEKTTVSCPVIFTTAYDEYALKAFKVNSIDYLLKPIDSDELRGAVNKYRSIHAKDTHAGITGLNIENVIQLLTRQYKSRFVVKVGEHLKSIPITDIHCFYSLAKATYLQTADNRNYVIDNPLEQLEQLLDPSKFFRVSRKFIVRLDAIADVISYSNSRLKIRLQHPTEDDIIVAREKVKEFKEWLEQ